VLLEANSSVPLPPVRDWSNVPSDWKLVLSARRLNRDRDQRRKGRFVREKHEKKDNGHKVRPVVSSTRPV